MIKKVLVGILAACALAACNTTNVGDTSGDFVKAVVAYEQAQNFYLQNCAQEVAVKATWCESVKAQVKTADAGAVVAINTYNQALQSNANPQDLATDLQLAVSALTGFAAILAPYNTSGALVSGGSS